MPATLTITAEDARLVLMQCQGLLDDPDRRAGPAALRSLISQLGFVQIDSINVIERAHHLTLRSRLASYQPEHLRTLIEEKRQLFEHWTHDASILPIELFAHWHHRRQRFMSNPGVQRWVKHRMEGDPDRFIGEVLARIEQEGPVQSRDFEHTAKATAWWGWKPAKAALEYLWWRGDLSVAARINFQKVYDLTERTYPDHHHLPPPPMEEFVDCVCITAIEKLGVATPSEIAGFFAAVKLSEARKWCERAIRDKRIIQATVESENGIAPKATFAARDLTNRISKARNALDRFDDRIRLLSPFDPVIRDRKRALRLFNFDYRFEAFVPEPKRIYGYYVLPILQGDQLIGRCDLKHHRKESELEVKGVWWEAGTKPIKQQQDALEEEVNDLACFVGAESYCL